MANMTSSVSASQVAGELASATFEEIPALVEHYREDPRQQVIKACERAPQTPCQRACRARARQ